MKENYFVENYTTPLQSDQVFKNGKFKYVSWANCQKRLKDLDPSATWNMCEKANGSIIWDGFVKLTITFMGQTETTFYPILDSQNNGVVYDTETQAWRFRSQYNDKQTGKQKPLGNEITGMDINNAQMRGFAKLFAMVSGYSLSIYTGEDLIQYESVEEVKGKVKAENEAVAKAEEEAAEITGMNLQDFKMLVNNNIKRLAELKNINVGVLVREMGITGKEDVNNLVILNDKLMSEIMDIESKQGGGQ